MIYRIYAIRDCRLENFGTPIFANNTPEEFKQNYLLSCRSLKANAERFHDLGDMEEFAKFAAKIAEIRDCSVYELGTYDSETCSIVTKEPALLFRIEDLLSLTLDVKNEPKEVK